MSDVNVSFLSDKQFVERISGSAFLSACLFKAVCLNIASLWLCVTPAPASGRDFGSRKTKENLDGVWKKEIVYENTESKSTETASDKVSKKCLNISFARVNIQSLLQKKRDQTFLKWRNA